MGWCIYFKRYNERMRRRNNLIALLGFFMPAFAFAATTDFTGPIVPTDVQTCAAGFGGLTEIVGGALGILISLGIMIAVLVLAYGGFLLVLNPVNAENRSKARTVIFNAIIGLVLTLAAWLLVNTLLTVLGAGGIAGTTTSLFTGGNKCLPVVTQKTIDGGGGGTDTGSGGGSDTGGGSGGCPTGQSCQSNNLCGPFKDMCGTNKCGENSVCSPDGTQCTAAQSCTYQSGNGNGNGGWTYDSGVQSQMAAASSDLQSLLSCMQGKLPAGVGRISAITDTYVGTNTSLIKQCADQGGGSCKHTVHSCHYGGRTCQGQSYAVDFGDGDPQQPDHLSALENAAQQCGEKWMTSDEGGVQTHLHVSVGSCGCDGH
jgi:hypothetical protein